MDKKYLAKRLIVVPLMCIMASFPILGGLISPEAVYASENITYTKTIVQQPPTETNNILVATATSPIVLSSAPAAGELQGTKVRELTTFPELRTYLENLLAFRYFVGVGTLTATTNAPQNK